MIWSHDAGLLGGVVAVAGLASLTCSPATRRCHRPSRCTSRRRLRRWPAASTCSITPPVASTAVPPATGRSMAASGAGHDRQGRRSLRPNKILVSNRTTLRRFTRKLPGGLQADYKTRVAPLMTQIDARLALMLERRMAGCVGFELGRHGRLLQVAWFSVAGLETSPTPWRLRWDRSWAALSQVAIKQAGVGRTVARLVGVAGVSTTSPKHRWNPKDCRGLVSGISPQPASGGEPAIVPPALHEPARSAGMPLATSP
jgi:hypothetical protein